MRIILTTNNWKNAAEAWGQMKSALYVYHKHIFRQKMYSYIAYNIIMSTFSEEKCPY